MTASLLLLERVVALNQALESARMAAIQVEVNANQRADTLARVRETVDGGDRIPDDHIDRLRDVAAKARALRDVLYDETLDAQILELARLTAGDL